jgi:hypothetical protein
MFVYATEVLHLSSSEAYLRITVARAAREHPVLLDMLADGRLHLSGISILQQHLTSENSETLLRRATHKSKREIEELVAELSPKPDVPTSIRKLPERRRETKPKQNEQLCPERVQPSCPETVEDEKSKATQPVPGPSRPAAIKPTAPARYKVEFTASAELRDKLERLQALMRSSVPDGDLAAIIDEAVTEKLERLEAKRYGKTKAPRKGLEEVDTTPSSRYIPAPVRRVVYERDGGRCTFADINGRRCSERHRLEFHHSGKPYGRGGDHHPSNIKLLCRAHNQMLAEREYGKEVIERHRSSPNRVSESAVVS